ncbi:hypothetical protein SAMN06297144_1887 [Sphingomonas guangdongensis]|uniref:Uncharacterized protein n=1 Tax=Sphingomonas guangdongensis TaxID=1141890 RepID=A0A285QZ68_9SPHN|nr:hypothetical protein [Sphingomonas guangdongensis]SOB86778.1 hypothetical protein SAMN06297144_1887 [Sphingomonas guangdongensis]
MPAYNPSPVDPFIIAALVANEGLSLRELHEALHKRGVHLSRTGLDNRLKALDVHGAVSRGDPERLGDNHVKAKTWWLVDDHPLVVTANATPQAVDVQPTPSREPKDVAADDTPSSAFAGLTAAARAEVVALVEQIDTHERAAAAAHARLRKLIVGEDG